MDVAIKRARIELLLLFILYIVLLPRTYMEYDMGFWRQWALEIHRNGLPNAYNSSINYFPVYLYGLYVYDLLQGTEANIAANINNIKILFVAFDFLPLVVLCAFRQRLLQYKTPYLFLLLNIAYVFNSLVWGQIDSIYTSLSFLGIVVALQYPAVGALLYLLALNTKPQAIVFSPVMAAVLWYRIRTWQTLLKTTTLCIMAQLALLIPFLTNNGVHKLAHHALHSVDLYNKLSISAFNIWYLMQPGNPYFINDKDTFVVLSYKNTGLLLFSLSAILILWPVAKHLVSLRKNGLAPDQRTHQLIFLGTGMLCLCFFYFNSQMHERYAHPVIIFFFFYGVVSRNYKLYVLASIPYFLSLDKAFSFPNGYLPIVHYKILFASRVIALWYTATVAYGGYLFWSLCRRQTPAIPEPIA